MPKSKTTLKDLKATIKEEFDKYVAENLPEEQPQNSPHQKIVPIINLMKISRMRLLSYDFKSEALTKYNESNKVNYKLFIIIHPFNGDIKIELKEVTKDV